MPTRAQAAIAQAARERGYTLESATYTPVFALEMGDGIGGWDVRLSCGRGWTMAGGDGGGDVDPAAPGGDPRSGAAAERGGGVGVMVVRVCANCPTVLSRYNAAALCARCGSVTANVRAGRPPSGHRPTCGCLSCADWRAAARRLGLDPPPARDWRGVPL